MNEKNNRTQQMVELSHGSGGRAMGRLVREVFLRRLDNPALRTLDDGALVQLGSRLAISTDGFVVDPIFFPGGDIGKLAVCGTVNDVAMCGAIPRVLTAGFILEEGMLVSELEQIVSSMAEQARAVGVSVVTGDTKVVPRGHGDRVFVTTTGVGEVLANIEVSGSKARAGDRILVSGPLGDHGATIMALRAGIELGGRLRSDCAAVVEPVVALLKAFPGVHCLRDPTRGGLTAVLNEFAAASGVGMVLREAGIPVSEETRSACEILGLDPLHMACEGRFVAVLPAPQADAALALLQSRPECFQAAIIGEVVADHPSRVVMKTLVGGTRLLDQPEGEPLPRIC